MFLSEGNKYFRNIIQKKVGPYLACNTKSQKGDAIAKIVQIVNEASPLGGFVKRDSKTGRWFKLNDWEARDKVGHAIRKAAQRMEDTKPKLVARLKREYATNPVSAQASTTASASTSNSRSDSSQEEDCKKPSKPVKTPEGQKAAPTPEPATVTSTTVPESLNAKQPPSELSMQQLAGMMGTSSRGVGSAAVLAAMGPSFTMGNGVAAAGAARPPMGSQLFGGQGLRSLDSTALLARSLPNIFPPASASSAAAATAAAPGSFLSSYEHMLRLQMHEQKTQGELQLIRALQQHEEATLRREIEHSSRRLAMANSLVGDNSLSLFSVGPPGHSFKANTPNHLYFPANSGTLSTNTGAFPPSPLERLTGGSHAPSPAVLAAQERLRLLLKQEDKATGKQPPKP